MTISETTKRSLLRVCQTVSSEGMGFVVGNKTKYVITCAHCVPAPCGPGIEAWQKGTTVQIKTLTQDLKGAKSGVMWLTGYEPYLDFAVLSCLPFHDYGGNCSTWCKTVATSKLLASLAGIPLSQDVEPPETVCFFTQDNCLLTANSPKLLMWKHNVWVQYVLADKSQSVGGGTSGTPIFDSSDNVWGFLNSSYGTEPRILVVNLKAVLPAWLLREIDLTAYLSFGDEYLA